MRVEQLMILRSRKRLALAAGMALAGFANIANADVNDNTVYVFINGSVSDISADYALALKLKYATNRTLAANALNSGHAGSLMSGQLSVGTASQSFSNLPSNNGSTTAALSTTYKSTLSAGHTDTVPIDLSSDAGSVSGNVNINIVGPNLYAFPNASFAPLPTGASGFAVYQLANLAGGVPVDNDAHLTDLDILKVSLLNDTSGVSLSRTTS